MAGDTDAGWSLVVTSIPSGNPSYFRKVLGSSRPWAPAVKALVWPVEPAHLPAEILSGLDKQSAAFYLDELRGLEIEAELRPSADVGPAVFRPEDFVPQRRVDESASFSEVGGCIVRGAPYAMLAYLRRHSKLNAGRPRWQTERGFNHDHPADFRATPRHQLYQEVASVLDTAWALAIAYSNRNFGVCVGLGENIMSFYQLGGGAPETDSVPDTPLPERVICAGCPHSTPYVLRQEPDAEFPEVLWGDCAECGAEVVVRGPEAVLCVRHGQVDPRWQHVPGVHGRYFHTAVRVYLP